MKTIKRILLLLGVNCLFFGGAAVCGERVGYTLTEADRAFFIELRDAIKRSDKEWLASHISFPITVNVGSKRKLIRTQKEFVVYYESIINCKVQLAVERQDTALLFKNWRGVMVGNGEIWFVAIQPEPENSLKFEYYITGINN